MSPSASLCGNGGSCRLRPRWRRRSANAVWAECAEEEECSAARRMWILPGESPRESAISPLRQGLPRLQRNEASCLPVMRLPAADARGGGRSPHEDSFPRGSLLGEASLRIRLGLTTETAVRERDRPYRGDAMRASGTVGGGGGNHDHRNEGADQDESKQPRHPFHSHHRRPRCRSTPTAALTAAPL